MAARAAAAESDIGLPLYVDDVLVDGGSVLQAFGVRTAGDIDLLW